MDPSIDDIGNINISDVIEVIKTTDPGFVENNRREEQQSLNMSTVCDEAIKHMEVENSRQSVYAEIVEQPASKALRFRYECEGRSAGSIPGVNSTPENKTYPSIRIVNYNGRAVVVVSCVTKDKPYKPHPHNLVGKEACKKGVCTVEISDNMTVTFANLGIQCVKKKDIEEALRVREEIRVDPFRTRFEHKKHPTSIDLNAVRLCFQVFLEGGKGKFTVPLAPIVSDIIYDKKAMSDLVICKLSHCSASVAGGMEMMLLCEKVAKEDIHVRFFEERDNQIVWDANADFQPTQVHKQVAIAFRTPSYRSQQVDQPVQVYIQLRRPSDGTTSEPLPFQMLPLGAGRPAFWSLRKAFTRKKGDPDIFSKILATEAAMFSKNIRNINEFNNNNNNNFTNSKLSALRALSQSYNAEKSMNLFTNSESMQSSNLEPFFAYQNSGHNNDNNMKKVIPEGTIEEETSKKLENNINQVEIQETKNMGDEIVHKQEIEEVIKDKPWFDYSEVDKFVQTSQNGVSDECVKDKIEENDDKFNELVNQVAELDEIYADTHTKMLETTFDDQNEQMMNVDFCDNQTYSSLQLAMKNPIELFEINDERKYEDVATTPIPPTSKRDVTSAYEEKLPPLPPKRIRKMPSMPVLSHHTTSSNVVGEYLSEAPHKNLPSVPGSTLTKPKQGLFSKLFTKKSRKDNKDSGSFLAIKSRNNIDSLRNSLQELAQTSKIRKPSITNISDVQTFGIDGDESPPYGMDLTEAEHYALYTSMAPHATTSEFDEMSFYYSPVEGGKISNDEKKA